MNRFSFLLQWASRSLGKIHQSLELREQDILDPHYRVYSKRYFHMRGEQEYQRSKMYYLPLSVGVVEILGLSKIGVRSRKQILSVLAELLKKEIRPMDVLASYEVNAERPFAFLLITASPSKAEDIRDRMLALIQRVESDLKITISLSHFNPAVGSWDELLQNFGR